MNARISAAITFLLITACASKPPPALDIKASELTATNSKPKATSGTLEKVEGDVQVETAEGKIIPAHEGLEVRVTDKIVTKQKSRTKIVMVDKNEVHVSSDTSVQIQKYDVTPDEKKNVLLNLLYGKFRAKVNQKYDGEGSRFQVKTPAAVAGVRGTDFIATFDKESEKTEIVTFNGAVEFGLLGENDTIRNPVLVGIGETSGSVSGLLPMPPKHLPREQLEKLDHESQIVAEIAPPTPAKPEALETPPPTIRQGVEPQVSLGWLEHGNTRFVKHHLRRDGQSKKDIARVAKGQHPHAIVFSCSDSIVPPELIFDQKLGEIFVVRNLGLTVDAGVIASIEYAVSKLGVRLLLVLSHPSCGADPHAVAQLLKEKSTLIRDGLMVQPATYSLETGIVDFR
jgi:hypothetical protein